MYTDVIFVQNTIFSVTHNLLDDGVLLRYQLSWHAELIITCDTNH